MDVFEKLTQPRSTSEWRWAAHLVFDEIWKSGRLSRVGAYNWLRQVMNVPSHEAHIKKLNAYQCEKLIKLAKEFMS